jgi:hypothetical protein
MRTAVVILVGFLALPAAAKTHPVKPPRDVSSLAAMCRHYVKVERKVSTISDDALLQHWEELHALRVGFVKAERRGELRKLKEGRRVSVRHVLAQLLGEQSDVSLGGDAKVERAHSRRTEDLFTLQSLAQRAFDIATADVGGTWSPG